MSEYKRNPNSRCSVCLKPIYKRPSQIKKNKGKIYCSSVCYGISLRKEKPCIICGKLILAGLNKKTCSRKCSNKNRVGIRYKIGRPKDKVSSLRIIKRRLMNDRGEKCEKCGYDKYEILQIHHKNRNNKDNNYKNLEIICPNCHYEEHYLENSWLRKY